MTEGQPNMETFVRQALARAYTHSANTHKEVDVILIDAMVIEIMDLLRNKSPLPLS